MAAHACSGLGRSMPSATNSRLTELSTDHIKHLDREDKDGVSCDRLWDRVDRDGSGFIDKQEFAVLYTTMRSQIRAEHDAEVELEAKVSKMKQRCRAMTFVALVLSLFCAASVAANSVMLCLSPDEPRIWI